MNTAATRHPSRIAEDRRIELEPYRDLTPDDVAASVAQLPEDALRRLAEGPSRNRWSCKACNVLEPLIGPGPSDPARVAMEYHEVPKLDMQYAEDQWYGEHANEVFRRCLVIYRAAGWDGDDEPNA